MTPRIFLTGFMASGKSTVGRELAESIGYAFLDLDSEIERIEDDSIADIVHSHGESYFRVKEREALMATLDRDRIVVSLGGGAVADPEIHDRLRSAGLVILLAATVETIVRRLTDTGNIRPLVQSMQGTLLDPKQLEERIEELLEIRMGVYSRADLTVSVDGRNVAEIVRRIVDYIKTEKA